VTESELCQHARQVAEVLRAELETVRQEGPSWSEQERARRVKHALQACLDDLAATDCWGEANRVPSNVLWQVVGEILQHGALQLHARVKPRGYAGDYVMLQRIWEHWVGDEPVGRAMDQFFQEQAAPQAVRNRTRLVADRFVAAFRGRRGSAEQFRIVSVGSGPAIDIELAVRQLGPAERRELRIALLDLDPLALEHARERLGRLVGAHQIQAYRENLYRLPRLPRTADLLQTADFVSCLGLFDYLNDKDSAELLSCLWRHLASPGELILFNFAPTNRSRAYMEWIGNWYLTYRDAAALKRLADSVLANATEITIAAENSGASLYLVGTR